MKENQYKAASPKNTSSRSTLCMRLSPESEALHTLVTETQMNKILYKKINAV